MVFQNYALYPHMTAYDNMAFALKLRKIPKKIIKEKVVEAARILDIEHLLNKKPKVMSGGQRQRIALGRAIVRHPKVFLLDEPLSNLDAKLRTQMRSEIAKLHQKLGTTFVYVTHDQIEAMTMGDRIVVMKDGVIQQVDTPYNLYNHPKNIFVAGFIGSPQMNFMTGTIIRRNDDLIIQLNHKWIYIPDSKSKYLDNYVDKKIQIGIRPNDIHKANDPSEKNTFTASTDVVEMMGDELNVHFEFNECRMIGKFPVTADTKAGGMVCFKIDASKIHLFDIDTGQSITA
jgi:multiple sugar transport system ATP-binding protein